MSSYPPPYPPAGPPPGYDPRTQRRILKEQIRYQRDAQREAMRAQRDLYRYQARSLRRSSIAGPILLVAVGVIFLLIQMGRFNQQHIYEWYATWWPTLLLGAGLVLLVEWFFDQRAQSEGAPTYRRSLGGIFFVVVPILVVTGVIASAARGHEDFFAHGFGINPDNMEVFLGDKHESDQTLDVALPAGDSVTVNNPHGDVTVSGVSSDGQIHIAVHKQIYTNSDSEADRKAQQLTPQVTTGSAVAISMASLDGAHADLVVTVPPAAPIVVITNHGDIHINDTKAAVTVTANHGDIELSQIAAAASVHINSGRTSVSAHVVSGGLTIEGHGDDVTLTDIGGPVSIAGEYFGTTHLERIAGAIHFHTSRTDFQLARLDGEVEISPNMELTADRALGPVTLTTRNRNITLGHVAGDISVTNRNGTVDLTSGPPLGSVTVENRNGSVKLVVPEHATFSAQADTTNGDIQSDFSFSTSGNDNHHSLTGSVGSGGPQIHITTSQGDIELRKGTLAPLAPPAAPVVPAPPAIAPKGPVPPPKVPAVKPEGK